MNTIHAVILAAGKGTRLPALRAKALQSVLGESMISYVYIAVKDSILECMHNGSSLNRHFTGKHETGNRDTDCGVGKKLTSEGLTSDELIESPYIWTVTGYKSDQVKTHLLKNFGDKAGACCVLQEEQLGTGHALSCVLNAMPKDGIDKILVLNADTPLINKSILLEFIEKAKDEHIAFASLILKDPATYGRVMRKNGKVHAITEAKDLPEEELSKTPAEVNAGIYLFDYKMLQELLPKISNDNVAREYYLTDMVALGVTHALKVEGIACGTGTELLGVNTAKELLVAEKILHERCTEELLANKVILHHPESIYISPLATIESGAEIYGPCEIYGKSHIETGVCIESHCYIQNAFIGKNTHVRSHCHFEDVRVAHSCTIGPFARLRPQAELAESVHIGNFVEVKKSFIGKDSKVNHLSYIGDSTIGENVNVGAGNITCNYDGVNKHRTTIGDNSFLGSHCAYVAPVSIGKNTLIAAGSVITKDVPDNTLSFARARQVNRGKK